jgi:hypothetical protein
VQTSRRDMLKGMASLPILSPSSRPIEPPKPAVPFGQPIPLSACHTHLGGISALTRIWPADAPARCRLCPECAAIQVEGEGIAYCTIITDDVALAAAPLNNVALWSCHHTDRD